MKKLILVTAVFAMATSAWAQDSGPSRLGRLREAGHAIEPADGGELVRDPAGNAFLLTAEPS